MQIVKYEMKKNILVVGFKEVGFVVYSQLFFDETKTREVLLQDAYIQVRSAIEYEKTQAEHSITTDETGEEFIPEIPRVAKVIIDSEDIQSYFSCLQTGDLTQQFTAKVYDQYGDEINKAVSFTLDTTPANVTLSNGLLTVVQVDNDYDLILTACCEEIVDTLMIHISKQISLVIELQKIKEQKILELNTACNQTILGGFPSSCTGAGHEYKFDMEYQGNITQQGVMLTLDQTITVVPWPTKDEGVIPHTRDQFIELCKEAQEWKGANIYRYFGLKAQVEACTDIEQVNAFAW